MQTCLISDSALQWWKTATIPPVPSDSLTENQKHQLAQSSDILSNQNTSSQPLVQPVHNGQEAIQCFYFLSSESVATVPSGHNTTQGAAASPLNLPWGVKLSEDKFIWTVQLTIQLRECQLRKCKVYALFYWSQEYRFNIHSSNVFCQASCARSCTSTFWWCFSGTSSCGRALQQSTAS